MGADSSATRWQPRWRITPASSGTFGPARLTRFRVKIELLEGPLQLYERCSPSGLATYWMRDRKAHLVAMPAE